MQIITFRAVQFSNAKYCTRAKNDKLCVVKCVTIGKEIEMPGDKTVQGVKSESFLYENIADRIARLIRKGTYRTGGEDTFCPFSQ